MSKNAKIVLAYLFGVVQTLIVFLTAELIVKPAVELIILVLSCILCGFVLGLILESGEA